MKRVFLSVSSAFFLINAALCRAEPALTPSDIAEAYRNAASFKETVEEARGLIPPALKNYSAGPIPKLSEADIKEAIEFGKNNKSTPNTVRFLFMVSKDNFYIFVCTNYYLIANYACRSTINNEAIDARYVDFLAGLKTFSININILEFAEGEFKISVKQAKGAVFFKDGVKVPPSTEYPLYEGMSPYPFFPILMGDAQRASEMLARIIDEIISPLKEVGMTAGNPITAPEYLFNYSDIDISHKYEIAITYEDVENRIPINFSNIK